MGRLMSLDTKHSVPLSVEQNYIFYCFSHGTPGSSPTAAGGRTWWIPQKIFFCSSLSDTGWAGLYWTSLIFSQQLELKTWQIHASCVRWINKFQIQSATLQISTIVYFLFNLVKLQQFVGTKFQQTHSSFNWHKCRGQLDIFLCVCVSVCAVWQTSDAGVIMPLTLSHIHIHILQESTNVHSAAASPIKTSQKKEEEEEDERWSLRPKATRRASLYSPSRWAPEANTLWVREHFRGCTFHFILWRNTEMCRKDDSRMTTYK